MKRKIFGGMVFVVFVLFLFYGLNSTTAYQRSDFLRLVENTDQCLIDCYAVIEVSNPTDRDIILDKNSWGVWHVKAAGAGGLEGGLGFQLLEDVSYDVEVDDYGNVTEYVVCDGKFDFKSDHAWCFSGNGSLAWNHSFKAIVPENKEIYRAKKEKIGSHIEKKTRKKYVDFNPEGRILKSGETYRIKISGKKKAQTGPNNIDWKIKFLDYEPDWAWWNSSWEYKRPVVINSSNNLTYYQVAINVTYDPDMQPDFDDLRFTNEEETAELSYWIESKSNGNWAYVWVKVDSIDTNNGTQAYMYYGNAGATSRSNGTATFYFFDDFEDNSLDSARWDNYTNSGGTITETGGELQIYNAGNKSSYAGVETHNNFSTGKAIRTRAKQDYGKLDRYVKMGFNSYGTSYSTDTYFCSFMDLTGTAGNTQMYIYAKDESAATYSAFYTFGGPSYSLIELRRTNGRAEFVVNGSSKLNHTTNIYTGNTKLKFVRDGNTVTTPVAGTDYYDWILLRQFNPPEPTYSIGNEETKPAPPENITGGTIKTTSGNIILDPATGIVEIDGKLTMKSPNGSWFCCGPSDNGTWTCSAGRCV